jgi:protein-S-isoprenylcysteine O-methyltransferase Ste14
MPTAVIVAGMALVVAGMALAVTASLYNHYAAATITVEKGQPVIDTGPYAWVRHPMYSGVLL